MSLSLSLSLSLLPLSLSTHQLYCARMSEEAILQHLGRLHGGHGFSRFQVSLPRPKFPGPGQQPLQNGCSKARLMVVVADGSGAID